MDLDVEVAKCQKKLELARLNLEKVRKVESQPEYEETVPANVRLLNEDKVRVDVIGRSTQSSIALYRGKRWKQRSIH